jgi:hypothetical protein
MFYCSNREHPKILRSLLRILANMLLSVAVGFLDAVRILISISIPVWVTFNFFIWVLFFFKVLTTVYCDIQKKINNNPFEERVLLTA